MASILYNYWKRDVMNGTIDMDTNTFYVMLINSSGVSAADKDHQYRNTYTTYEVTGTGYTAGGTQLTTLVVSADLTNDLAYFDGADVSWASATVTARGAIVYKSNGSTNGTTDNLVCMFDFGSDQTATNGTFTIQWSTAGLIRLS
jgi:hypothetical protein